MKSRKFIINSVLIVIRGDRDWLQSYAISDNYGKIWNASLILNTWNRIFNIDYVSFRRSLREIQKINLREVKAPVIDLYDFEEFDGYVMPTDDDDWYHPNVVDAVLSCNEQYVYWDYTNYTHHGVMLLDSNLDNNRYESNNYAILKGKHKEALSHHVVANATPKSSERYLSDRLSVHNRSLASLGLLNENIHSLENHLLACYELFMARPNLNNVDPYFEPLFEQMHMLYKRLKPKKIFM